MILYKAAITPTAAKFNEYETIGETAHFYIIMYKGQEKRASKKAKRPFASVTKKQALETLIHQLEGFKFAPGLPMSSGPKARANAALQIAQNELKNL